MSGGYGLIGGRLGHSFSKPIHESLWADDYRMIELPDQDALRAFMDAGAFAGVNVTIPYKKDVMAWCDEIDPAALEIGCVNTLVRGEDGSLHGYNTDFDGLQYLAAHAGISFAGAKVVILGTGGTSLTAAAVAKAGGAREIVKISRTGENNYGNIDRHAEAEVLVNTTPVGMYPDSDGCPVDLDSFKCLKGVLDVVYNPLRTRLVLEAVRRGIPAASGLGMLVHQAVAAATHFTGQTFPDDTTPRLYGELWRSRVNLVLTGMPGSGKSSVGQRLAARLGRPFADTDEHIAARAGKSIPDIFAQDGEAAFRDLESTVLAELCAGTGNVIATGGGAVLREENARAMRRTGRVYRLTRDIDLLATDGRPLSTGPDGLRWMQGEREPFYRAAADMTVANDGTVDDAVRAIEEDFLCVSL